MFALAVIVLSTGTLIGLIDMLDRRHPKRLHRNVIA